MQMTAIIRHKHATKAPSIMLPSDKRASTDTDIREEHPVTRSNKRTLAEVNEDSEDNEDVYFGNNGSFDELSDEAAAAFAAAYPEESDISEVDLEIDKTMRKSFQEYAVNKQNLLQFTTNEISAIQLLAKLRKTKAPLNIYESVMH
jgi:hypothetical protein